ALCFVSRPRAEADDRRHAIARIHPQPAQEIVTNGQRAILLDLHVPVPVDEAGNDRLAGRVDASRSVGNAYGVLGARGRNAPGLDYEDRVLDRLASAAVDQPRAALRNASCRDRTYS